MKLHAVDIVLLICRVLQNGSWVGAIIATLVVTTLIIKFNWYAKLEKAQ